MHFNKLSIIASIYISSISAFNNPADFRSDFGLNQCDFSARAWIRCLFHDAGTFSNGRGGLDGSLQFELDRPENNDGGFMAESVQLFVFIANKNNLTVADTLAFAGILAIEVCGGPNIPYKPGRIDALTANDPGLLPGSSTTGDQFISTMVTRLGLTVEEAVAVVGGAHSVANGHGADNITPGPFDTTPSIFDNRWFIELSQSPILPVNGTTRLPSDSNIVNHPVLGPFVRSFAADSNLFRTKFVDGLVKLSNLGPTVNPPTPPPQPTSTATAQPISSANSLSTSRPSSASSTSSSRTPTPHPPCFGPGQCSDAINVDVFTLLFASILAATVLYMR